MRRRYADEAAAASGVCVTMRGVGGANAACRTCLCACPRAGRRWGSRGVRTRASSRRRRGPAWRDCGACAGGGETKNGAQKRDDLVRAAGAGATAARRRLRWPLRRRCRTALFAAARRTFENHERRPRPSTIRHRRKSASKHEVSRHGRTQRLAASSAGRDRDRLCVTVDPNCAAGLSARANRHAQSKGGDHQSNIVSTPSAKGEAIRQVDSVFSSCTPA